MENEHTDLDQLQQAYKRAVEQWIIAIRNEEELASANHSAAQVDRWEQAHFDEEEARKNAKAAKERYETALRERFFGF